MEKQRQEVLTKPHPIEILHFENYDALVNNRVDGDPQRVQQLLEQVCDGVPTTWVPLKGQPRVLPNIFLDNPSEPQFVAKKRKVLEQEFVREAFTTPRDAWHYAFPKREILAYNSLAHEIQLAPRIKRILDLYEAKLIAANHGYIDIRYVEPIIGIINRQTGEKTMFYDYVDGDDFAHAVGNRNKREEEIKIQNFSFKIYQLFIQHDVYPEDLWPRQFIYPHNNQMGKPVYLIDTEGFYETKHPPSY